MRLTKGLMTNYDKFKKELELEIPNSKCFHHSAVCSITGLLGSQWGNMPKTQICALLTTHRLSSQSRLTSRFAVNTLQSKGISVSVLFILPLFCLFLECLGFILGGGGSTLHILFHSAHCSFHR